MDPFEQAKLQSRWREAKFAERRAVEAARSAQEEYDSVSETDEDQPVSRVNLHLAKWALECAQTDERNLRHTMFGAASLVEDSMQS